MLFVPPAPTPTMNGEIAAPARNPFPFQHKPNTLDRDRIVVPAGWDSWGKITVMREFDPKVWGEAWEQDMETEDDQEDGAKRMYAALVPDQGRKVHKCHAQTSTLILTRCLAPSAPAFQQPNTRASLPREKLRREFQKTRPRSAWCFPESSRPRRCSSGNRWSSRKQQFQPAQRGTGFVRDGRRDWRTKHCCPRRDLPKTRLPRQHWAPDTPQQFNFSFQPWRKTCTWSGSYCSLTQSNRWTDPARSAPKLLPELACQ